MPNDLKGAQWNPNESNDYLSGQLSHLRGCLIKQLKMEGVNSMRYPPHTPKKLGWARFFILKTVDLGWPGRMALLAVLAVVAAVVIQVSHFNRFIWNPPPYFEFNHLNYQGVQVIDVMGLEKPKTFNSFSHSTLFLLLCHMTIHGGLH